MKAAIALILGGVVVAAAMPIETASASQDGSRTYARTCGNCHEFGSMGAPRRGELADWRRGLHGERGTQAPD